MSSADAFPPPRSPRYQSLDIWRGVACLMVVIHHSIGRRFSEMPGWHGSTAEMAAHFGWGGVALEKISHNLGEGVSLFFVISGYCIAASCDSARRKPQSFARFYARRFRRIFPPYWIYLALLAIIFGIFLIFGVPDSMLRITGVSINNPWTAPSWSLIGSLLLTSTWQDRLVSPGGMISGQAWSLCYEEQFYLVSGLLVWLAPRRLFAGMALVTILVLGTFIADWQFGLDLRGIFLDGLWLIFAAGVLVYYRVNYAGPAARAAALAVLLAALASLIAFRWNWYPLHFYLGGFGFALLLCGLHRWDHALTALRPLQLLAWCGRMCYSLYLIHYPIASFTVNVYHEIGIKGFWPTYYAVVPTVLLLSLGCSYLFAVLVERRFLSPQALAAVQHPQA